MKKILFILTLALAFTLLSQESTDSWDERYTFGMTNITTTGHAEFADVVIPGSLHVETANIDSIAVANLTVTESATFEGGVTISGLFTADSITVEMYLDVEGNASFGDSVVDQHTWQGNLSSNYFQPIYDVSLFSRKHIFGASGKLTGDDPWGGETQMQGGFFAVQLDENVNPCVDKHLGGVEGKTTLDREYTGSSSEAYGVHGKLIARKTGTTISGGNFCGVWGDIEANDTPDIDEASAFYASITYPARFTVSNGIRFAADFKYEINPDDGTCNVNGNLEADSIIANIPASNVPWDTLAAYIDSTTIYDSLDAVRTYAEGVAGDSALAHAGDSLDLFYRLDGSVMLDGGARFWGQDATLADSFWIYDDGDTTRFDSDNPIKVGHSSLVVGTDGAVNITKTLTVGDSIYFDGAWNTKWTDSTAIAGYGYTAGVTSAWADSTTFLMVDGQKGIFGWGNTGYGTHDSTHVNLGVACITGESGQNHKYATVGGGQSNTANGERATIGGGWLNTASGAQSTVGGGYYNTASADYATVGGGDQNTASGYTSTVSGGSVNTASSDHATVGGGSQNSASGDYSAIPGGYGNVVSGNYSVGFGINDTCAADSTFRCGLPYAEFDGDVTVDEALSFGYQIFRTGNILFGDSAHTHVNLGVACTTGESGQDYKHCTVGGGSGNTASGDYTTVGGGSLNTASGVQATVGGGYGNYASYDYATVGGGQDNTASGERSIIGGGYGNTADSSNSTVGGGQSNTASNHYATVGGGTSNTASGSAATVGGGSNNSTSSYGATVGGGDGNTASGERATVGGGQYNSASGVYSASLGGYDADVSGEMSCVFGDSIDCSGDTTFVFGSRLTVTQDMSAVFFNAAHPGKFGINNEAPSVALDVTGEIMAPIINVADSLIIPLWPDHPTDGTVGLFGLDTLGTDTLWLYTQAGWLAVAND